MENRLEVKEYSAYSTGGLSRGKFVDDTTGKLCYYKMNSRAGRQFVPFITLSDAFTSFILQKINQPTIKSSLARVSEETWHGNVTRPCVVSENILQDNEMMWELSHCFHYHCSQGFQHDWRDYHESGGFRNFCFQNIKLKQFIKKVQSQSEIRIDENFVDDIVNRYLTAYFIGNQDMEGNKNLSVISHKEDGTQTAVRIAPANDFEYTMLIDGIKAYNADERHYEKVNLFPHAEWLLNRPMNEENRDYIMRNHKRQAEQYFDHLSTLRSEPYLDEYCDFTHLNDFFSYDKRVSDCFPRDKVKSCLINRINLTIGDKQI